VSDTVASIDDIVRGGGEPDDVLRSVVEALAAEAGISYVGIVFLEEGERVSGPQSGEPNESRRVCVPVLYDGNPVAELWIDGEADRTSLERVADLISPHCLVGWDTGGVPWGTV
jgi:putative methionine-R-sulfoxide reductase with GAF domain